MDINHYSPSGGTIIGADGKAYNIVDLLGGTTPANDRHYDITQYTLRSGLIIGRDNRVYDLVDLLTNAGSHAATAMAEQLTARAEATGDVAQLDGLAGGLPLAVKAKCLAWYAGPGDGPSPDNLWTLEGRHALKLTRCGRNLLDLVNRIGSDAGGTRTLLPNGFRQTVVTPGNVSSTYHLPLTLLGKTVTLSFDWAASGDVAGQRVWIHFGRGSNSTVSTITGPMLTGSHITLTTPIPDALPEGTEWLAVRFYTNYSNAAVTAGSYCEFTNIMLEIGEHESPYEAYRSGDYALALPEPVYGLTGAEDEADLTRSVLMKKTGHKVFDGTEAWAYNTSSSGEDCFIVQLNTLAMPEPMLLSAAGLSNAFPWVRHIQNTANAECVGAHNTSHLLRLVLRKDRIADWSDAWSNAQKAEAAKTWLAARHAAGAPIEIVYELARPCMIPITAPVISSMEGTNTVFSGGGEEIVLAGRVTGQWLYDEIKALKERVAKLMP